MGANQKENVIQDKEPTILRLQEEGLTRREIADKLYSGNTKSRLDCLRKYMTKRGYVLQGDKYVIPGVTDNKVENVIKGNFKKDEIILKENRAKEDFREFNIYENNVKEHLSEEELKEIRELLKFKKDILKLINSNDTVDIIKAFSGDLKVKTIKIYKDIALKLEEFIEANKGYKQQDILTTAIAEYLEKRPK